MSQTGGHDAVTAQWVFHPDSARSGPSVTRWSPGGAPLPVLGSPGKWGDRPGKLPLLCLRDHPRLPQVDRVVSAEAEPWGSSPCSSWPAAQGRDVRPGSWHASTPVSTAACEARLYPRFH